MTIDDHMSPQGPESATSIVEEFIYVVNSVYGAYLDASMAVGNLATSYMQFHKAHLDRLEASGQPLSPELVNPVVIYSAAEERAIHQTTLVDIIERNAISGRHMQFLARMSIVALYQYWEEDFRPRLRAALGTKVEHDTFGELRHLRRSIIHRSARALPDLATCKSLPQFAPDAEIILDHDAMDRIINAVKQAAIELGGGAA